MIDAYTCFFASYMLSCGNRSGRTTSTGNL
jgi:hypothetical protein